MKALGIVIGGVPMLCCSSGIRNRRFCVSCSSTSSSSGPKTVGVAAATKSEYKPGVVDDLFLNLFRNKLVQEVGWDSKKAGYDGLIEVANRLMVKGTTNSHTIEATVFVERCKYLEESKCVGICLNTCKFPTQTFFKDHMGVPLLMEPNFADYSCQFKFGVLAPLPEDDAVLKEPCLEACPNASQRRMIGRNVGVTACPKT